MFIRRLSGTERSFPKSDINIIPLGDVLLSGFQRPAIVLFGQFTFETFSAIRTRGVILCFPVITVQARTLLTHALFSCECCQRPDNE